MISEEVKLCAVSVQQTFEELKVLDINTNFLTVNYPNFMIAFHYLQQIENEQYAQELKESPPTPTLTGSKALKAHKRMCNYSSYAYMKKAELVTKSSNLKIENLLHAEWKQKAFRPAYYLWYDDKYNELIFSIRGTSSISDAMTDLATVVEEVEEGVYAHLGMYNSAKWFDHHLFDDVDAFLQKTEECKLVIVGHSLGAGTAAILAHLWKNRIPDLSCYCYATPPVLDQATSHSLKDHVTTVILRNDIIPRMSLASLNKLRLKLLEVKWKKMLIKDLKNSRGYKLVDKSKNSWDNWEKSEDIEKEISRVSTSFKSKISQIDKKFNISPFVSKLSVLTSRGLKTGSEYVKKGGGVLQKKKKKIQKKIKENQEKKKKKKKEKIKNLSSSSLSSSGSLSEEINTEKEEEEDEEEKKSNSETDNHSKEGEEEEKKNGEKEEEKEEGKKKGEDDEEKEKKGEEKTKEEEKEEENEKISTYTPIKPKKVTKEEMIERMKIVMTPPGQIFYLQHDKDSKHFMGESSSDEFLQISCRSGFLQHHFLKSYQTALLDVKKYHKKK
ncbi:lipase class 3 protein-like [Anaeramoeba flamelloides]|uniref:Lipase class 3 protein-like n=1 Tax=Anaeramoeba flamelloides TaxID=1746091 RepID=A0ABQ8ZER2_9EUKA|nr:lipase class 3 protein-like [Anaeramoeba flamelloides]